MTAMWSCALAQTGRPRTPSSLPAHNGTSQSDTTSHEPEGIDYDHVDEADSTLCNAVHIFAPSRREVKLFAIAHPVINPTGMAFHDPLDRFDGDYYLGRGLGRCHQSVMPRPAELGFRYQADANAGLTRHLGTPALYQVQRPFTTLGYASTVSKDLLNVKVAHTQNIMPRWNVAFDVDAIKREGVYSNSGVASTFFDVTTNYYSADSRYQIQAGVVRNKQTQEENGGVENDTTCWLTPNRAGVPVKMYDAANEWRDFTLFIHQSFNTVRQFETIRPRQEIVDGDTLVRLDTLQPPKPHVYNTGVFGLDLQMDRHRRNFYDNSPTADRYDTCFFSTARSWDSTRVANLSADLYWTNDAYMSHRWVNPLVISGGLKPQLSTVRHTDSLTVDQFFSVEAHAEGRFELKKFRLEAEASEVTGSHRNGDYRLRARMLLGQSFSLEAMSQAQAPDYFYYHYISNNYQWQKSDYRKVKEQLVAARYELQRPDSASGFFRALALQAQGQMISDNVWLSSAYQPEQGSATGLLGQLTLSARMQAGWFHFDMQQTLQHSTDPQVVRVPLFASKNSLYADVKVFHGALWLQTGLDLRYHTRYYADGWNPALGAFYRQDEVLIGNYLWADFFATIQVKQASIYLKVAHFNAPLEQNPRYFVLPHHPGEDLGVFWGVNWKFFN